MPPLGFENFHNREKISSKGRMEWEVCPDSVLVIRKLHYDTVGPFVELAEWLLKEKNMFVFVEEKTLTDDDISSSEHSEKFEELKKELKVFQGMTGFEKISEKIDFVVCLGGDGTLLYASSLFPSCIPPVMSFNLGSLGFLTPFDFTEFKEHIEDVIQGNMKVLLRSRLHAELITPGTDSPDVSATALNEIVVDRGSHHYLSNLELYVNDNLVTQVQADGIIIATPTGSTAYSLSAGAGMVHPAVPAILITPICPHSLSFRPIVVPSTSVIKIKVVPEARKHAVVSFDGRLGPELQKSQDLIIKAYEHSLPTVSRMDHDWFNTLQDLLAWNTRVKQKALTNNNKPPTKL